jgi:hypothetical protein
MNFDAVEDRRFAAVNNSPLGAGMAKILDLSTTYPLSIGFEG